jgi:uncharacterized protein (TIGR00369 family)
MIDHKNISLSELNRMAAKTLAETLAMTVVDLGPDFLEMEMPVTEAHHQPLGYLHGGATIALAENAASLAANLYAGMSKSCMGLSVNANHIGSIRSGTVKARAELVHAGRSTQLWRVEITAADRMISSCQVTMMVLDKPAQFKNQS